MEEKSQRTLRVFCQQKSFISLRENNEVSSLVGGWESVQTGDLISSSRLDPAETHCGSHLIF